MGRQMNCARGGRQENKQWPLIHGSRFLTVFLVISMIHVATSQDKMSTLDQGYNIIRSPRYAKATGKTNTQSNRVCNNKECIDAANEINRSMNLAVDPCDDFYEYACGRWPKNNKSPSGDSYYSVQLVAELTSKEYKKGKLEKANIRIKGASRELQKMPSDFYHSCINLTAIDYLDDAPLRERIRELGGWNMSGNWDEETWDFNETLLSIHKNQSGGPLFRVGILPNKNNKKKFFIVQDGTSVNKVQYLNLSSKTMLAYRQLIIDVVVLLGGDPSTTAKQADEIIRFEAQLANVSLNQREVSTTRTIEQLQREVSKFNWINYFNKLFAPATIPKSEIIEVSALPCIKKALEIIDNTPNSVLANYIVWYKVQNEIQWLSKRFRDAELKYKQATTGAKSDKELRKKCVDSTFDTFEDIMSAAYINDHNAELARPIKMVKRMLKEEIQAFKENVNSLTWLGGAFRNKVFEKIDGMGNNVGFPDYMLDSTKNAAMFEKYQGLTIRKKTYFKNKVSIIKNLQQQKLKDFRKPTDETIWYNSPLTARPIYEFSRNNLTIPAAILQPPVFYRSEFLRAYNLGNLGSIVGHGVTQGFGINGRLHDKDGKIKSWWPHDKLLKFIKSVNCYTNQYSMYKIFGKWPMNKIKTVEANIGDNEGLKVALKTYYNWAKKYPSESWRLPGLNFTNEQLFYIGFAQSKCSSSTREQRIKDSKSKPHADAKFRIIGPLANSCDFANAFKCEENSPMNPIKKCYLWSKEGPLV